MSTNVDFVDYIGEGRLQIRRGTAVALSLVHEDYLAEGNLFQELELEGDLDMDEMLVIESPSWYGEFSGSEFDTLIELILPETKGHAQLLVTWEGGNPFTGYEVNDGVVTEREVIFTLGEVVEFE